MKQINIRVDRSDGGALMFAFTNDEEREWRHSAANYGRFNATRDAWEAHWRGQPIADLDLVANDLETRLTDEFDGIVFTAFTPEEEPQDWLILNARDGRLLDHTQVWPVWTNGLTRSEIKIALLTIARSNPGFLVTAVPLPEVDESLAIQWSKQRECYVDRAGAEVDP